MKKQKAPLIAIGIALAFIIGLFAAFCIRKSLSNLQAAASMGKSFIDEIQEEYNHGKEEKDHPNIIPDN